MSKLHVISYPAYIYWPIKEDAKKGSILVDGDVGHFHLESNEDILTKIPIKIRPFAAMTLTFPKSVFVTCIQTKKGMFAQIACKVVWLMLSNIKKGPAFTLSWEEGQKFLTPSKDTKIHQSFVDKLPDDVKPAEVFFSIHSVTQC